MLLSIEVPTPSVPQFRHVAYSVPIPHAVTIGFLGNILTHASLVTTAIKTYAVAP